MVKSGALTADVAHASIQQADNGRRAAIDAPSGRADKTGQRALEAVAALPHLMARYENLVKDAVRVFADRRRVHEAREATRDLIEDGRITLTPTKDRKALEGTVKLKGLGHHLQRTGAPVN